MKPAIEISTKASRNWTIVCNCARLFSN